MPLSLVVCATLMVPDLSIARLLGTRSLEARSSVGVQVDLANTTAWTLYEDRFPVTELVLDGELAVGENAKFFARIPLSAGSPHGQTDAGLGNITVGGLAVFRDQDLSAGGGASISALGTSDGDYGELLFLSILDYEDGGAVLRGFGGATRRLAWSPVRSAP